MNSHLATQMIVVRGPRSGKQIVRTASTSAQTEDLSNPAFDGLVAEIHAEGGDLYIMIAPSSTIAGQVDPAARGGIGTAGLCARIPSGQAKRFALTATDQWLGYRAAAGAPVMRIEFNSDVRGDRATNRT
jgi:hypothetical protein